MIELNDMMTEGKIMLSKKKLLELLDAIETKGWLRGCIEGYAQAKSHEEQFKLLNNKKKVKK